MAFFAFMGSDPIGKQEALDATVREWLGSACEDELSRNLFFGEDLQIEKVAESYQTVSLFSSRKALIFKGLDKASAAQQKALAKLWEQENPDCGVFAMLTKWDAGSALAKLFKSKGTCKDFKQPYPNQIPAWLTKRCRSAYSRSLSGSDARLLQDIAGNDLGDLDRELQKLDAFLPKGRPVDGESILAVVDAGRVADVFELQSNMGLRDKTRFLYSLRSLLDRGETPFQISIRLFTHFALLMKVRNLSDKGDSPAAICDRLKLNPFFHMEKLRFMDQAHSRSLILWKKTLVRLGKMEMELKAGKYTHRFEVEMAFANLV